MPLHRGFFISFEGGEGTGKSTQIRRLESHLRAQGRDVLVTWEPGGTATGERIRTILLDPDSKGMDSRCEALLYAAARAEHVARVVRPALERGTIVLCDRYIDASKAYQGAGRRLGMGPIEDLSLWATDSLIPDRIYLFDGDPTVGLDRARARGEGKLDRLEQESLKFHQEIRQAYLFMARQKPERYCVIDASRERDAIFADLARDVEARLATDESCAS